MTVCSAGRRSDSRTGRRGRRQVVNQSDQDSNKKDTTNHWLLKMENISKHAQNAILNLFSMI